MTTAIEEVDVDLQEDGLDGSEIECLCSNWLSLMINLTYLKLVLQE